MMSQDMSHFEQKFKRKDQARVMINYYLQDKVRKTNKNAVSEQPQDKVNLKSN
jgi:hypothetical protein